MKKTYWTKLVISCILLTMIGCSSSPKNIGHKNGKLNPCADTPNCVSTADEREKFGVDEIKYKHPPQEAKERLLKIITQMGGEQKSFDKNSNYYHFEFTSRIFRFVDDLEIIFGEDSAQISSRSRVGRSDFGVNRSRVEDMRFKYIQDI